MIINLLTIDVIPHAYVILPYCKQHFLSQRVQE